jgi:hypothetical protein
VKDERSWLKRFVEDFGKVPEEEPKELIPHEIRVPVFLGIVAVSLVLLGLLLWFLVIPAIRAQTAPTPQSQAPTRLALARA